MEKNFSYGRELKNLGISYLGSVAQSMKMRLSYENGTMTYCLYLAPANMSGYNVCPKSEHCKAFCLNGSGQNKCDELSRGVEGSKINQSRIKKTKLFFQNRVLFMNLLIHEIKRYKAKAERLGMGFSVRLNGTSDLSPVLFKDPESGLNLLELFPDVQFYDYTKVYNRIKLMAQYPNYDLTFSYDGFNADDCERFLQNGGRVAVVFFDEKLPKYFKGYKVVNGNDFDMRYLDPKGCVVGLHYHKTANDYYIDPNDGKRKFRVPETPFVVKINDERCEWF